MNKFQRKIAKETKKRLDLSSKVEEFSAQLENVDTFDDVEKILDQIDLLPSWYEVKKQVSKDLKSK
ncbi:MAG: hypothetical protein ACRC28_07575 [Clostridium sp.]|uniref:hypothetical protein n=1 Tax=Clostridium sp. TaxID=1506 RepID=UPI003F30C3E3